jgi:putative ABC transport system permease protein
MSASKQFLALLEMNLAGIGQRVGPVLTIVIGVTCAVGVLVSMLAMGVGAHQQAMGNVRADRVVLVSTGAPSAMQSDIPKDVAYAIRDLPGIKRGEENRPLALLESMVDVEARRKVTGTRINFPLSGVSSGLANLRPELQMTAGRMFQPGLHELIASSMCARQYAGFNIGDKRGIRGSDWSVVGHFDLGHAQESCTVYADADTVLMTFGRDTYNRVTVMLQAATTYSELLNAITSNPRLRVEAKHESEAVEQEFKQFNGILNFASYFVGAIMAVGATLGAMNSLFAIVDARRRELATLRAIGFGPGTIIVSILSEAILLALPGALLGGGLAWIFFNGLSASPFGFSFQLAVTPSLVVLGIGWALGMGLLGGILPALRATRVPVTTALRAT